LNPAASSIRLTHSYRRTFSPISDIDASRLMKAKRLTPKPATLSRRALTSAEFSQLAAVPPETEWSPTFKVSHQPPDFAQWST
jgi:hypothetical protein